MLCLVYPLRPLCNCTVISSCVLLCSNMVLQLDMRYLPDVIEKLEGLLLPVANGDDPADDKPLVIGILRFLSCILKNSIHKRYFLIVEVRF